MTLNDSHHQLSLMLSSFVLPSYISSDKGSVDNSGAAVRARGATKRPTVLLAIVQLLRFCTSPAYVARRQEGDLAKIDLAATKKHVGTPSPSLSLTSPPSYLAVDPPGVRRRVLRGFHLITTTSPTPPALCLAVATAQCL